MKIDGLQKRKSISMNALTIEERIEYLQLLSDDQIVFLNSLGRYRLIEFLEGKLIKKIRTKR